ncbi:MULTISPECIES: ACT domain-containing protein [Fusobacterium]|jgi:chorismate mutase|uniref:ACT domain-containing protein n=1 Tax=Fusobacterium sp. HC1336 TaxID=3171169 RepID=UPI0019593CDC|nr:ACT domain-containing protein [Fusobacterium sp.]MBM6690943.1 ACT domain-containing protein [Fusobacterium mortiferum]MDO5789339.1 ACT domain-containing protein [Fusobacterium sp.]
MKGKYLIVDKSILPDYFEKVIEVRNLLRDGKFQNVSEAVKEVGISRSTYYKYKDFIFSPSDSNIGRKALISIMLEDKKGALSEILNFFYSLECNIITINQNIPINEVASIIISMDISDTKIPIEEILTSLKNISYVVSARLVALE